MIKKLLNFALLLCMLVLGAGNVWGEEVTFDGTNTTWSNTQAKQSETINGITIETSSGVYNTQYRIYKNQTFTVSSSVGNITKVEITCTASGTAQYGPGCFTGATFGTYSYDEKIGTWAGNAENFTLTASTNQVRATKIVVTYTKSDSAPCSTPTLTTDGVFTTSTYDVVITNNEEGATVYYTTDGNDPTTSSESFTGASKTIQISATTTVKAMAVVEGKDNSSIASATYTYETSIANTAETAYTTAEAIDLINANSAQLATTEVYVKGKISKIGSFNEKYGSLTFWLDGDAFEVYGCLNIDGTKFAAVTDLAVGDEVVVLGKIKLYGTTYEMDLNGKLISRKTSATQQTATVTAEFKSSLHTTDAADVYDVTYNGDGKLSVESSATDVATISIEGNTVTVKPEGVGTTTITISASETETYYAAKLTYVLTVIAPTAAAELPFEFDGGKANIAVTTGMSHKGLGSDYNNSPKLKFDDTDDNLVINYASSAKTLEYAIKGNGSNTEAWSGTFDVLESADGTNYTIVKSYTEGELTSTKTNAIYPLNPASRFVKFVYTNKSIGNVALGAIKISDTVELADPELAFNKTNYTFTIGSEGMAVIATSAAGSEGAITYALTEGDADAFLIDENTGDIVCETAGTYTVTATIAATSVYATSSATAVVTIVEKSAEPTYYAVVSSFGNAFYAMGSTVDNKALNAVAVNVANSKVINAENQNKISWTLNADGSIQSAEGMYINYDKADISLKETADSNVYKEADDESGFYWLSGTRSFIYRETETFQGFKNYATSNASNSGYGSIGYLMTFADGYVREITLGEDETEKIGTICLDRTIEAEDLGGAKFYSIEGKVMDGEEVAYLALEEETEGLIAGYPYIFIATGNVVAAYTGDVEAATAESNNGLVGSLDGCNVEQGKYLISGNKLVKCGTDCKIGANRAYVDMTKVPEVKASEVKGLILGTNGLVDGIQSMSAAGNNNVIYNLAGQRMSKAQKGLYIVNGKKVVK